MRVDFTGRGIDITDRIRSFAESKLSRLEKLAEDMHDVSIVLSTEKYRHRAEINFLSRKRSFHGNEETNDMFQAIDNVVSKLESQLKKVKGKETAKKRSTHETIRATDIDLPSRPDMRPLASEDEVQVIRIKHTEVRPMNLEEAVEVLRSSKREFLFFRSPETNTVNVIYNRHDGHIGHLEPGV
jgi:putative sigma-54 modulation protein